MYGEESSNNYVDQQETMYSVLRTQYGVGMWGTFEQDGMQK